LANNCGPRQARPPGAFPGNFFTQEEMKMCMDDYEFWNQKKVNNARERNEANDAAVYARKGLEIAARTYVPDDTSEYVILANYPGENDFEVLGVGTKSFGLKLGLEMDRDVNIFFM
jgi:hypothetical protein